MSQTPFDPEFPRLRSSSFFQPEITYDACAQAGFSDSKRPAPSRKGSPSRSATSIPRKGKRQPRFNWGPVAPTESRAFWACNQASHDRAHELPRVPGTWLRSNAAFVGHERRAGTDGDMMPAWVSNERAGLVVVTATSHSPGTGPSTSNLCLGPRRLRGRRLQCGERSETRRVQVLGLETSWKDLHEANTAQGFH
jgi:hypothetical protein